MSVPPRTRRLLLLIARAMRCSMSC